MRYFLTLFWLFFVTGLVGADDKFEFVDGVQLAKQYDFNDTEINIADYWVSEKLDGIRARWDGSELRTRNGNKIFAPAWFTAKWPKATIDGELWIEKGEFERTASIVLSTLTSVELHSVTNALSSTKSITDATATTRSVSSKRWTKIRFMAFDMPMTGELFQTRLNMLNRLSEITPNPTFAVIPQFKLTSIDALEEKLNQVTQEGGEGLMLHHEKALYISGRSNKLLKVKRFEDAEGKVLAQLPGKGRFKGMMGSLLIETREGIQFKLGTGFSKIESL